MSSVESLAEFLYDRSGGMHWAWETGWQERHREEARQWFAYAEMVSREHEVWEIVKTQWRVIPNEVSSTHPELKAYLWGRNSVIDAVRVAMGRCGHGVGLSEPCEKCEVTPATTRAYRQPETVEMCPKCKTGKVTMKWLGVWCPACGWSECL